MEMEAVEQEQASLENQLAHLKQQIANLTSEIDANKKKVKCKLGLLYITVTLHVSSQPWKFIRMSSLLSLSGCFLKQRS